MSTVEVEFNPFDPSFVGDPYPHWKALRERAPVHRTEIGFWVLTRYDDVLRFVRDPALSVEDRNARPGPLVRSLEPLVDPELIRAIADAGEQMHAFTSEAISWKRRQPGDDLLSALIAAEEGDDVLTDDELVDQVMLLYIAGHETTVNLIGNGTLALLRNRTQLDRLQSDASLDANAIEELLRYDPPLQMTRRITLRDVEIGGHVIEAGTFVVCVIASANRDRIKWGDDAEALDITREDAHNHL